jgi:hypothetical protein
MVATLVVAAAILTFSAIYTYRHTPPPPTAPRSAPLPTPAPPSAPPPQAAPTDLAAEFAQLASRLNASMGISFAAVGSGQPITTWGDWPEGPAWSTIKVPLVIAAYRQQRNITANMKAAITESDNAAAEALWQQLGAPPIAAQQVQQVLHETGDPTVVESRRLRAEFTAFGQTTWSPANQVRFLTNAFCDKRNDPVFTLMGEVDPQQSWGIGSIAGTQFKGGWGPSSQGKYLVRQFGVLTTPTGKIAVAIAAEPASGSFDDGRAALDKTATWLKDHLGQLPTGRCKA